MSDMFNKNDTLTGICNSALAMVGHTDFISDISDLSPNCEVLRVVLEQVCKEVQSHEYGVWDELIVETILVKRGDVDYEKSGRVEYNLPFNLVAPIVCFEGKSGHSLRYEIVGGKIVVGTHDVSDDGDVWLRYIRYSFDPSEWSVELKTCVIKLLSARVIASIVKDYNASQAIERHFWDYDYKLLCGNKKNKARRSDFHGNDSMLTERYWNGRIDGEMDIGGY